MSKMNCSQPKNIPTTFVISSYFPLNKPQPLTLFLTIFLHSMFQPAIASIQHFLLIIDLLLPPIHTFFFFLPKTVVTCALSAQTISQPLIHVAAPTLSIKPLSHIFHVFHTIAFSQIAIFVLLTDDYYLRHDTTQIVRPIG